MLCKLATFFWDLDFQRFLKYAWCHRTDYPNFPSLTRIDKRLLDLLSFETQAKVPFTNTAKASSLLDIT